MKGRSDEAWHITAKLHGGVHDTDSHASIFAKEEFYQMSQQVAADTQMASGENLWTLFKKPSYRRRMICGFITMFGAESTGILVIYSMSFPHPASLDSCRNQLTMPPDYSILLYQGLGFKGAIPLLLAAAYVTVACIGNFINSLLIDRIGRKALLRKPYHSHAHQSIH